MASSTPKRPHEDDCSHQRRVSSRRGGERHRDRDDRRGGRDNQHRNPRANKPTSARPDSHNGNHAVAMSSHPAAAEEGEIAQEPQKKVTVVEDDDDQTDYDLEFGEDETDRILEESRKRRQAILAKYSATASPAVQSAEKSQAAIPQAQDDLHTGTEPSTAQSSPRIQDFSLAKGRDALPEQGGTSNHEEVSAADYDPGNDRAKDEAREQLKLGMNVGIQPASSGLAPQTADGIAEGLGEPVEAAEEYEEIEVVNDDDLEDMFSLDDDAPKKKIIRVAKGGSAALAPTLSKAGAGPSTAALQDNWDDLDGYYRITLGETLDNGRYQVFANLGRGMFASVVRARDLKDREREVAIKIVRVQETMCKAGLKEISILKKLGELDPEDKRHVVRLEGHFEHRGHLCMVFESLSMNLREVVKRFGKDVGLNLRAVKAYAYQMFQALSLLKKANLMHADIKPDNILINDAKTVLKVCDLGSASDLSEMEITPYLVSRFYRAPEISQAYDSAIDVWSIGCTLYELGTGKVLLPGRTNNQMLLMMQELKGRFTTKQIRKSRFGEQHFDDTNAFLSQEKDKSTGQDVIRRVVLQKPSKDLKARLLPGDTAKKLKDEELRLTMGFVNLLNRCLELDPAKRITPKEALTHSFLSSN